MLDGRKVRVEFGSAEAHLRSKPWLMREKQKANEPRKPTENTAAGSTDSTTAEAASAHTDNRSYNKSTEGGGEGEAPYPKRQRGDADFRERKPKKPVSHERVKPGQALYAAQRQKPSVQEFTGSKITFD